MQEDNLTSTVVVEKAAASKSADLSLMFRQAMLAGISISIGCVVFLRVGGVAGAVLFALGLLTVVHFKLPLYTGTAGFVMNRAELNRLWLILAGNIAGCLLMAWAMAYAEPDLAEKAGAIAAKRMALGPGQTCVLALLCGFLMTVAVKFAREKSFLPLLFAVPVFILSGFIHSIADAFYLLASPLSLLAEAPAIVLLNYLMAVIGNFIGCNLWRLFSWKLSY
ncbi:MAG: formate/nitrite transporter family protein [Bacteroidales bacterium]|nr:formate/nitrite transporter family protein [Bacteroidales bacterium]